MIIEDYTDETDYLAFQLYLASKSARIRKKRLRSRIVIPIMYTVGGILLFLINDLVPAVAFFILGVLWYFIYPLWERRHYIKHFQGFIKENYKDRIGRAGTTELNDDLIITKCDGMESKVQTSELKEIIELPTIIIIKLKPGQAFILSKDKIKDASVVINKLKDMTALLGINYVAEPDWKWE